MLTSCSNYLAEDENESEITGSKDNIPLTLKVRSSAPNVDIVYPINVYIFNETGKLVRESEINASRTLLDVQLPAGKYTLSAFTGLNDTDYTLPKEISQSSVIISPQGEPCKTPLQYGYSSFRLDKKTELSIHLSYIVTSLDFTFSDIPADVTKVEVGISPTSQGVNMDGSVTNDAMETRVSCQKQGDLWTAGPIYVLPSQGTKTVLALQVDKPEGSQNLTYSYNSPLLPAQPYRFSGKYHEGIKLNGNFECEGWKPGIDVDFDFSEEGEEGTDNPNNPDQPGGNEDSGNNQPGYDNNPVINCTSLPNAGDFWKGFYVWKSDATSSHTATAVLVSKKQWFNIYASDGMALLSEYVDESLGNWRVFTKDEAREFNTEFALTMNILNGKLRENNQDEFYFHNKERYLCDDCQSAFNASGKLTMRAAGKTTKYYMRGIKTVQFKLTE